MIRQISFIFYALAVFAFPATAQNAAEIAKAESGESCSGCNLFQADLSYTEMRNLSFSGARLRQSDMSLATMDGVNFSAANLSIANLYGGRFTGANFENADLTDATLVGGSFINADFSNANLTNANLSGAEMSKSIGLTQGQLDLACGDETTQLPSGLKVQQCR